MLAPLPELNLKRVTSNIEYTQVHIHELAEPLWLPREVEVLWETNGGEDGEVHRYSKYQLFRASIKLRPLHPFFMERPAPPGTVSPGTGDER